MHPPTPILEEIEGERIHKKLVPKFCICRTIFEFKLV